MRDVLVPLIPASSFSTSFAPHEVFPLATALASDEAAATGSASPRSPPGPVRSDSGLGLGVRADLRRAAEAAKDLDDPQVMEAAWR